MNRIFTFFVQQGLWSNKARRRVKLRFAVNQAAAHGLGIHCPKPIVTLEIEPASLTPADRALLEPRLLGVDVCIGMVRADGTIGPSYIWDNDTYGDPCESALPCRVEADRPTFEGLMDAVRKDESRVREAESVRAQAAIA